MPYFVPAASTRPGLAPVQLQAEPAATVSASFHPAASAAQAAPFFAGTTLDPAAEASLIRRSKDQFLEHFETEKGLVASLSHQWGKITTSEKRRAFCKFIMCFRAWQPKKLADSVTLRGVVVSDKVKAATGEETPARKRTRIGSTDDSHSNGNNTSSESNVDTTRDRVELQVQATIPGVPMAGSLTMIVDASMWKVARTLSEKLSCTEFIFVVDGPTSRVRARKEAVCLSMMPSMLLSLTPYTLCEKAQYHKACDAMRECFVEQDKSDPKGEVFGAFVGKLLVEGRTRSNIDAGVTEENCAEATRLLLPILRALLSKHKKLVNRYVTHDSLKLWLKPGSKALFADVMGEPTRATPGLFVEQPVIFFICRARHIYLLHIFVHDYGAIANYTWRKQKFEVTTASSSSSNSSGAGAVDTTTPTLLSVMCNSYEHRSVPLLLHAKANVDEGCPIFFAARSGNVRVLKMLLKVGTHADAPWQRANINAQCGPAGPAIVAAAQFGRREACRCLIQHKANVNLALNDGTTAIYYAAQEGRYNTAKTLLTHGAEANKAEVVHEVSPLYIAASQGHLNVVKLLLNFKADVNLQRDTGATALCCVVRKRDATMQFVDTLLSAKADPNLTENIRVRHSCQPKLPLQYAFEHNRDDIIVKLVNAKSNLVQGRWTALYAAVHVDRPDIIRALAHSGKPLGQPKMFVSLERPQNIPLGGALPRVPEVVTLDPLRSAIEQRRSGCVTELLLIPRRRQSDTAWMCEYEGCCLSGTWDEICAHEQHCDKNPRGHLQGPSPSFATQWHHDDANERRRLETLKQSSGAAQLAPFKGTVQYITANERTIGDPEPMSMLVQLFSDFTQFHLAAAAGDVVALGKSCFLEERGFHKHIRGDLTVEGVADLACNGLSSLLGYNSLPIDRAKLNTTLARARMGPYEVKEVKYVIAKTKGPWSMQNHAYYGLPHDRGVREMLLCGKKVATRRAGVMQLVMATLLLMGRGSFEYTGDSKQGLRDRGDLALKAVPFRDRQSRELATITDFITTARYLLQCSKGGVSDAADLLKEAHANLVGLQRSESADTMAQLYTALGSIAEVWIAAGNTDKAVVHLKEAMEGLKGTVGDDDSLTLRFKRCLAHALKVSTDQRQRSEAAKHFNELWLRFGGLVEEFPDQSLDALVGLVQARYGKDPAFAQDRARLISDALGKVDLTHVAISSETGRDLLQKLSEYLSPTDNAPIAPALHAALRQKRWRIVSHGPSSS